ncbi:MAG: hypothetical protein IJA81_02905 [Akkermansia sp.]|nr:hypothetical protein [Akkermansia sp.]
MRTYQTRLKKTFFVFRKVMWAFWGYLSMQGVACAASSDAWQDSEVSHHCESNDKIADVVMTVHHLQVGAKAGCPRCQATLAWLTAALQPSATTDANPPVAVAPKEADTAPHTENETPECQRPNPLAAHRLSSHANLSDAAMVEWAEQGCTECKDRLLTKAHCCPSNVEVREGRKINELKRGAAAGCARCRINLQWWNRMTKDK